MGYSTSARLVFMANADLRLMVIRPIGRLPATELLDQMFEKLAEVETPWHYDRAVDLRRFEGELTSFESDALARRWKTLRGKNRSFAHVALIRLDACRRLHEPGPLPGFPDETLCRFTSYNEAYGWLTAGDRHHYLNQLANSHSTRSTRQRPHPGAHRIDDLIDG
ncbi:hypothetical protein [Asticcacaulis sp. W401b]|uniref:hypothetical protein n=1 Tax=Asticcacaulis sp. W401b TaxID=3388666 RepID=UPI003970731F